MWATSKPILVFLGISVLDLGSMYATDRRQTERQTDVRQHHRLMPPPMGLGIITTVNRDTLRSILSPGIGVAVSSKLQTSQRKECVKPRRPWPRCKATVKYKWLPLRHAVAAARGTRTSALSPWPGPPYRKDHRRRDIGAVYLQAARRLSNN